MERVEMNTFKCGHAKTAINTRKYKSDGKVKAKRVKTRCAECMKIYDHKRDGTGVNRKEKYGAEKLKARITLHQALKSGKIIKLACIKCGDEVSQAHHPDYSKPLKVIWLCKKHHIEEHHGK